MKIKAFLKNIDYRHYVCAVITVAFVLVNIFCFPYTFPRLAEAVRDFGLSIAFFFTEMFGFSVIVPSVPALSKMPFTISDRFPETWEAFKALWSTYWKTWAKSDTLVGYFLSWRKGLLISSYLLTFLIPVVGVLVLVLRRQFNKQNNDYNVDSKPLRMFKKISDKTYRPVKAWIGGFIEFVKSNRYYVYIWILIALLSFNIVTILFEVVAYYYYFAVSFDVGSLYLQLYKLLLDLSVIYKFVPFPVWIILGFVLFYKIRNRIGYNNLQHFHAMNCGFIKDRGVFSLIVAPMRQGKTKLSTSMALTRETMFRDMAYRVMLKCDLKFPYFPWINFELSLRKAIDKRSVYNLATVRRFVKSKMLKFYKSKKKRYIFGYDFERYGLSYDNKKYIEYLEDVLSDYGQAYFIYIVNSSLIISNYSIRVDDSVSDIGNFPLRSVDFFKFDSKLVDHASRYSHIIDYDVLRLGKKVVAESKYAFEFGVIDITEIAKERLNMVESEGIRKQSEEANQKNDGFDDWVKMCGHNATVDFNCFVSIYADDQREENLGAGLRGVGEILRVEENTKDLLALPCFFLSEIAYHILSPFMERIHKTVRFNQGGNTLFYYIIHTLLSKFESYYRRTYNVFGYEEMKVSVQDGAQNNDKCFHKYYILNKKDLSKRYSTDCLGDLLSVKALRAVWGLDDVASYKTVRASSEEIKKQNSFFVNRVTKQLSREDIVTPKKYVDFLKRQYR